MKPTPQLRTPFNGRRFSRLRTDWNYQSNLETARTAGEASRATNFRPLWKLSTGFFRAEGAYDYVSELALFVVISTLSAWSILVALLWIPRMVHA